MTCYTMQYHVIPCNTMQYHAIPCNTMQYHAIQCNTMQYYSIQSNTMKLHAIPCIIINCWRSVPLPCGQYMAIFFQLVESQTCAVDGWGLMFETKSQKKSGLLCLWQCFHSCSICRKKCKKIFNISKLKIRLHSCSTCCIVNWPLEFESSARPAYLCKITLDKLTRS